MKRSAVTAVAAIIVISAPGSQVVFPPLNRDTIVGTWEALSVEEHIVTVERIEISKDGPSFFAYQIVGSPVVNVFRLIAFDITDQKISMHFRGESAGGGTFDWFFEGTGEGIAQDGMMSGRLFTQIPPAPQQKNAFFQKGSWTHAIADSSRNIEEGIRKARDEAKQ